MVLACARPVGAEDEGGGAEFHAAAEEFGEAEVVADGGAAGERVVGPPLICHDFVTADEGLGFFAERERVDFGVLDERDARGVDDAHHVEGVGRAGGKQGSAALNEDPVASGE